MSDIRGEERPRVLRATEVAMRVPEGLFDPGFIDTLGVAPTSRSMVGAAVADVN